VLDARTGKTFKTLRRWGHANICTTAQFRPGRPWELLSGGMDASVIHWDASKGKPFQTISMAAPSETAEAGGQMCNPPLVNSVALSADGARAAVGLADFSVAVLQFGKRGTTREVARFGGGHCHGVSQVHFPAFDPRGKVISGGNDRRLCLWDLSSIEDERSSQLDLPPSATVGNAEKINWIASRANEVLVADTSATVKLYEVH
jgi:WD40 repeat protein